MGTLVSYLYLRFLVTNKYEDFDFGNNRSWFNSKFKFSTSKLTKHKRVEVKWEAIYQLAEVVGMLDTDFEN